MTDICSARGYGSRARGWGAKPAVLVVDFQRGFTEAAFPMGGAPMVDAAVERSVGVIAAAKRPGAAGDRLRPRLPLARGRAALEGRARV